MSAINLTAVRPSRTDSTLVPVKKVAGRHSGKTRVFLELTGVAIEVRDDDDVAGLLDCLAQEGISAGVEGVRSQEKSALIDRAPASDRLVITLARCSRGTGPSRAVRPVHRR